MASELDETPQRWTAKRRSALVLSLLRGETSAAEAARKHGLTVAQVEEWREVFLLGAENALRTRPRDEEALRDEQIRKLKEKVGDLVMDLDILKEAMKHARPQPWVRIASASLADRATPAERSRQTGVPERTLRVLHPLIV